MNELRIVLPTLLIGAGISLFTATLSAVVGIFGHRVPLYLTFAVTCLCAAAYFITTGAYHTAPDVAEAITALRWQVNSVLVFLPAFYWFVAIYTGQKRIEPGRTIIAALSAGLLVANMLSAYTLRFAAIEGVGTMHLPWGETVSRLSGSFGPGIVPAHLLAWTIFTWALWRAVVLYRGGRRRSALFFGACLALLFGTTVAGLTIDLGLLDSIYLAGFGFLGFVVLMAMSLAIDLRDRNIALENAMTELREETAKRRGVEATVRRQVVERETLELDLQQSQKMQAMGLLAGGVAHDFNNLLTVILGGADLGARKAAPDSNSREGFLEIKKAALRAGDLTSQLLSFGRRQVLKKQLIDVNHAIGECTRMMARVLGEEIEIRTNLAPGLPGILGDSGQIQQVLLNLCTNARDAMPQGGALTIATRTVPGGKEGVPGATGEDAAPDVVIAVTDTGIGMDESTRARIFEPFFTTKSSGRGTGLGLAVVHGIVAQHGGRIVVASEVGRGTTIEIHLPSSRSGDAAPAADHPAEIASPAGETILLIEDDEMVREMTVRMLIESGYRVLTAGNAEDGLRLFQQRIDEIDAVMADVVMPGRSGPDVCSQMRIEKPNLSVLFVTGYDVSDRLGEFEARSGTRMMDVLVKPYNTDSLEQKLRELLSARAGDAERATS